MSPGYIWTEVLDRGADGDREKWEPIWGRYCPMERCAEPYEVASAIAFLASGGGPFVTGADLAVDGGLTSMSPDGLSAYEFRPRALSSTPTSTSGTSIALLPVARGRGQGGSRRHRARPGQEP
ncbi:SDR family oxidoreductase [Nonomuraea sp. PA05]|uniref:SDR family oxidoreductase n=1 Tax=Nonomuraea sp. PA05 TaxID=2604466 RepID=UPI0011DB88F1|nr:SDR family oxidoreductase [Nonomuraea sp. PA05]